MVWFYFLIHPLLQAKGFEGEGGSVLRIHTGIWHLVLRLGVIGARNPVIRK